MSLGPAFVARHPRYSPAGRHSVPLPGRVWSRGGYQPVVEQTLTRAVTLYLCLSTKLRLSMRSSPSHLL